MKVTNDLERPNFKDYFAELDENYRPKNLKVDFLGELPLHMDIRKTSDAGTPIVLEKPNGDHASIYKEIAGSIWSKLNKTSDADQKAPPKIIVA